MIRGPGRPLMVDLEKVARDSGHETVQHMLHDLYVVKGMSVIELSDFLRMGDRTVKRWLRKSGIPVRGRGGPNNVKVVMTPELLEEIKRDGARAVALRIGVEPSALELHLKKLERKP